MKAAEFTSTKIAGLDVKTREDYMSLCESSLADNYNVTKTFQVGNLFDSILSEQFSSYLTTNMDIGI